MDASAQLAPLSALPVNGNAHPRPEEEDEAEISDTDSNEDPPSMADQTALAGFQVSAANRSATRPAFNRPGGYSQPGNAQPAQANGADADDSGTDTDEDGNLIAQARLARDAALQKKAASSKRRAPTGKPRIGGGISMKLLIEEGLLIPGENVLTSEYKGANMTANLNPDGRISYMHKGELMTFESPSAFSIFFKRLVNPARKADDGWKTVRFQGKFLDHYKMEYARHRFGNAVDSLEASNGAANGGPPKRARLDPTLQSKPSASSSGQLNSQVRPQQAASQQAPSRFNHHPMDCSTYSGAPPGSMQEGAQPFRLAIAAEASVLIDLHSHLSTCEVAGLLGGTWDESQRLLTVHCARPVKNAAGSTSDFTVPMDAEDKQRVQQDMQARLGLQCIGTFHSRPCMPARPSGREVHQQVHEQHAARKGGFEPWVSAVCCPFGTEAMDAMSGLNWIHISHPPDVLPQANQDPSVAGCEAFILETEEVNDGGLTGSLSKLCEAELQQLINRIAPQATRAGMLGKWRGTVDHLAKLKVSLAVRLPDSWPDDQVEEFVNYWADAIKIAWQTITPQAPSHAQPAQAASQPHPQLQPRPHQSHARPPTSLPTQAPPSTQVKVPQPAPQPQLKSNPAYSLARAPSNTQQPRAVPLLHATAVAQRPAQPPANIHHLPNGYASNSYGGGGLASDGSTAQDSESEETEDDMPEQRIRRPAPVRGYGDEDDTLSDETQ